MWYGSSSRNTPDQGIDRVFLRCMDASLGRLMLEGQRGGHVAYNKEMGGQAYSSWDVSQRDAEDKHAPHNDMQPSCRVPRRRPHGPAGVALRRISVSWARHHERHSRE